MCCIAGLFVQLGSIFIGVLQIIVYAGAIIVLFLFVIMMFNLKYDEFGFDSRVFQRIFAAVLGLVLILQLVLAISKYPSKPGRPIDMSIGDVESISLLYKKSARFSAEYSNSWPKNIASSGHASSQKPQ